MENKTSAGKAGYVTACVVWVILLLISIGVLICTFKQETKSFVRIKEHYFLAIGLAVFFVSFIIPRIRHNVHWLMNFTHEFTHLFFAFLFFRKIHRFNVDRDDSHVSFSGGWLGYHAITLSPYCVPIFTLALLPWRFTSDQDVYLHVIDILIGITYAFHLCCWIRQTRLYQTDITGPGVVKSLLCITTFHILNFCLVLQTPTSGVLNAIERVFWIFPKDTLAKVWWWFGTLAG